MNIEGQAAIITGGASGLGAATAKILVAAGAKVAIIDRNADLAEKFAAEAGVVPFSCDVTNGDAVEEVIAQAAKINGPARIVVNCAGIGTMGRTATPEDGPHPLPPFKRVVGVNVTGTFNVLRLAAYEMIKLDELEGEERGVIINTASIAGIDGSETQTAYAASKAAVIGMTLPLARDLAPYGIRVVSISPGIFETPLSGTIPDNFMTGIIAQVPFPRRQARPEEFGNMVQHICENQMLNGENIRLDGALRMGREWCA